MKKRRRESFINKNLIREIKNKKPLIYFPLNIEPERSLLIAAPNYTNQIEVIKRNFLPSDEEIEEAKKICANKFK